jgi:hypothetical protein
MSLSWSLTSEANCFFVSIASMNTPPFPCASVRTSEVALARQSHAPCPRTLLNTSIAHFLTFSQRQRQKLPISVWKIS